MEYFLSSDILNVICSSRSLRLWISYVRPPNKVECPNFELHFSIIRSSVRYLPCSSMVRFMDGNLNRASKRVESCRFNRDYHLNIFSFQSISINIYTIGRHLHSISFQELNAEKLNAIASKSRVIVF